MVKTDLIANGIVIISIYIDDDSSQFPIQTNCIIFFTLFTKLRKDIILIQASPKPWYLKKFQRRSLNYATLNKK